MVNVIEINANAVCKETEVRLYQGFVMNKPVVDPAQAANKICAIGRAVDTGHLCLTDHQRPAR